MQERRVDAAQGFHDSRLPTSGGHPLNPPSNAGHRRDDRSIRELPARPTMRQINRTARGDSFFSREFYLWGRAQVPEEGMGQAAQGRWSRTRSMTRVSRIVAKSSARPRSSGSVPSRARTSDRAQACPVHRLTCSIPASHQRPFMAASSSSWTAPIADLWRLRSRLKSQLPGAMSYSRCRPLPVVCQGQLLDRPNPYLQRRQAHLTECTRTHLGLLAGALIHLGFLFTPPPVAERDSAARGRRATWPRWRAGRHPPDRAWPAYRTDPRVSQAAARY